jgi:Trypsin-co-occurring domain 2
MRDADARGIELAEAIGLLRTELLKARAQGVGQPVQFPVNSLTVKLKVAATRSADGKAGFSVPIVNLELGGSAGRERETIQKVTVVFGPPVDRDGNPVKVAAASDEVKK